MIDTLNDVVVRSFSRRDSSDDLDNIDSNGIASTSNGNRYNKKRKTAAKYIVHLMRYGWKLPSPQLIISVTGGAYLFKLGTPRTRYAFQRDLVTAAVTTGIYIFIGKLHQINV